MDAILDKLKELQTYPVIKDKIFLLKHSLDIRNTKLN